MNNVLEKKNYVKIARLHCYVVLHISLNLKFCIFLYFFLFTQHMCSLRCYTDAAKNDIFRLPIDEMFLCYLNDET